MLIVRHVIGQMTDQLLKATMPEELNNAALF